jgi:hypothetical protein
VPQDPHLPPQSTSPQNDKNLRRKNSIGGKRAYEIDAPTIMEGNKGISFKILFIFASS